MIRGTNFWGAPTCRGPMTTPYSLVIMERIGFRTPAAQPEVIDGVRVGRRLVQVAFTTKTKEPALHVIEWHQTFRVRTLVYHQPHPFIRDRALLDCFTPQPPGCSSVEVVGRTVFVTR